MTADSTSNRRRPGGALREANRLRVVDELRLHGTLSRADLARLTRLSPTTMTALVAELVTRGLVVEQAPGAGARTARGGGGAGGAGGPPRAARAGPPAGPAAPRRVGRRRAGHRLR